MATGDEQIGANVARLRGRVSQSELAAEMKRRGWRWSQATVWSIEKGDRPLRLAEAEDLAQIIAGSNIALLLQEEQNSRYTAALDYMDDKIRDLGHAASEVLNAQEHLAAMADRLTPDDINVPDLVQRLEPVDRTFARLLDVRLRQRPAFAPADDNSEWETYLAGTRAGDIPVGDARSTEAGNIGEIAQHVYMEPIAGPSSSQRAEVGADVQHQES